jgi:hypothetical protein
MSRVVLTFRIASSGGNKSWVAFGTPPLRFSGPPAPADDAGRWRLRVSRGQSARGCAPTAGSRQPHADHRAARRSSRFLRTYTFRLLELFGISSLSAWNISETS